ncbi:4-hydroxy-tetrahydrodipicolinate reductase [Candidatus Providencia siddallii]|uniref:4-hydroxy-tetrahydrodipicolinate reductase n=1 Tax=Candidatus Providencia siddallii TaxID=1715285 RepID=A0A0M6W813_9GAMM|nr:4-hydroxy-tetrahydrodipicolinate reductase [Candidatus Providencia siddallii]
MINSIVRIVIIGAYGRMGQQIIKTIQSQSNFKLIAAIEHESNSFLKEDIKKSIDIDNFEFLVTNSLNKIIDDFDVVIDFSSPKATIKYLNFCKKKFKAMVIGTTGFNNQDKEIVINASKTIPIVFSSNFSIGANLLLKLLEKTAKLIGRHSDIEIIETHHRNKIDSPSGTALLIGESVANALEKNLKDIIHNTNNKDRDTGTIVFTSIRSGDIIGEHTAIFNNIEEQIKITHKVSNRITFAKGALKAAYWVINKKPGLYNMKDVLDINNL